MLLSAQITGIDLGRYISAIKSQERKYYVEANTGYAKSLKGNF